MKQLLVGLLAAGTISTAQAQSFMSLAPAEGLPICAAAFSTMSMYATSPRSKDTLLEYSARVAMASKRYNSNGPNDALTLTREMYLRSQNEAGYMATLKNTARNCQQYVAQYGVN